MKLLLLRRWVSPRGGDGRKREKSRRKIALRLYCGTSPQGPMASTFRRAPPAQDPSSPRPSSPAPSTPPSPGEEGDKQDRSNRTPLPVRGVRRGRERGRGEGLRAGETGGDEGFYPLTTNFVGGSFCKHEVSMPFTDAVSRNFWIIGSVQPSAPPWPPWGTSTIRLLERYFAALSANSGGVTGSRSPAMINTGTSEWTGVWRPAGISPRGQTLQASFCWWMR